MNRNFEVSTRTVKFNGNELTEITTTLVGVAIRDAYSNPDLYKETDTPDHLEKLIEALIKNEDPMQLCQPAHEKSFADLFNQFEESHKLLLEAFFRNQAYFACTHQDQLRNLFTNVETIITTIKQTTVQFKNEKS